MTAFALTLALSLSVALDVALPPLDLTDLLPPLGLTKMALQQNGEYRRLIEERLRLQPYHAELHTLMTEACRRHALWDALDDAQRRELSLLKRRLAIAKAAKLLGWSLHDFSTERLPLPVPGLGD